MGTSFFFKRLWAEALPFVARSPEMKVEWLLGVFKKNTLSCSEIAPYMHLLLSEYSSEEGIIDYGTLEENQDSLKAIFSRLPREVILKMLQCTEIYDIPVLLELANKLTVDEAVVVLRKVPPPYEKNTALIFDRVFQAVHSCGDNLLDEAAEKMDEQGEMPEHFKADYDRFKEILMDEKILTSLYPQAKS